MDNREEEDMEDVEEDQGVEQQPQLPPLVEMSMEDWETGLKFVEEFRQAAIKWADSVGNHYLMKSEDSQTVEWSLAMLFLFYQNLMDWSDNHNPQNSAHTMSVVRAMTPNTD